MEERSLYGYLGRKEVKGVTSIIMGTEEFVSYFESGEKYAEDFSQGLEWELFLVNYNTLKPASYFGEHGILQILKELSVKLNFEPIMDGSNIIGLKSNTYNVTLEPGGQIELSGSTFKKIKDGMDECKEFLSVLKDVCLVHGLSVMPAAYHPVATVKDVDIIPKTRYAFLAKHFKEFGLSLAFDMMKLTTSVQTSIDYSSELDFIKKLRTINALSPILSAIYSNSSIVKNTKSGYLSYRGNVWQNTEKKRSGIIEGVFDDGFGYARYAKYMASLPVVQGDNGETVGEMSGITFEDYKKKHGTIPEKVWDMHVSFSFTVARAKKYIEIRCFDNQKSIGMVMSIPALIKGLFYSSDDIFSKACNMSKWLWKEDLFQVENAINKYGLSVVWKGCSILKMAQELYHLASAGLEKTYPEERCFLLPLEKYIFDLKYSPGEELVRAWNRVNGDIHKIKNEFYFI